MAQISAKFYSMVLVLSFLLMILSHTESRTLTAAGEKIGATIVCNTAIGAEKGDTCDLVAKDFGLTLDEFFVLNPNIKCNNVFIGQWLCIAGST